MAFAVDVLTATGILVLSLVMLKGVFQRRTAYLGVATGILGIFSEGLRTDHDPPVFVIWYSP